MKKLLCLSFLMLLLSAALFATSPEQAEHDFKYGGGIALGGTKGATGGVTEVLFNVIVRPFSFRLFNPFLRVEGGMRFNRKEFDFSPVNLQLGFEVLKSEAGFLSALKFTNKEPWTPAFGFGLITQSPFPSGTGFVFEVSACRFLDADFIFEFFAPYLIFNRSGFDRWGLHLFRLSALF